MNLRTYLMIKQAELTAPGLRANEYISPLNDKAELASMPSGAKRSIEYLEGLIQDKANGKYKGFEPDWGVKPNQYSSPLNGADKDNLSSGVARSLTYLENLARGNHGWGA